MQKEGIYPSYIHRLVAGSRSQSYDFPGCFDREFMAALNLGPIILMCILELNQSASSMGPLAVGVAGQDFSLANDILSRRRRFDWDTGFGT
jgi:hypothetical protein